MKKIDITRCISVKNKKSTLQCKYKCIKGSLYCGIHLRSKKKINVTDLRDIYDINSYYKTNYKNFNNNSFVYSNSHNINSIKIQSLFRKYINRCRYKCTNKIDCFTLNSTYDIPLKFLYIYYQQNINKYYAFDIRYLYKLINFKILYNPYTNNNFSNSDIEDINNYIQILKNFNYNIHIEKDILTEQQKINSYVIDTFHKIDLLGNYTDIAWFNDLNLYQLIKLYQVTRELFNFKLPISKKNKKKYVKDGKAFTLNYFKIKKIKNINKIKYIILDEYNKFLDFNNNDSDKKTSAIWLLLGLITVSKKAKYALRHLII